MILLILATGLSSYLDLLSECPSLAKRGEAAKGEIELVLDAGEIEKVEEAQRQRWIKKGFPAEMAYASSRVGIVAEDPYWIWVRDAVHFPSGAKGTYERLFWKCGLKETTGVSVLPILPDGKILLLLNYRHATRSWEWEVPRGTPQEGESKEEAARRELSEETGCICERLELLGHVTPDAGILGSVVPVFVGYVAQRNAPDPNDTEAIQGAYPFTLEQIEEGLYLGTLQGVPVRDAFLTYALHQVQNKSKFEARENADLHKIQKEEIKGDGQ